MENLLRSNERRRLKMAEILFEKDDWMTVAELSEALDTSPRMLKYDFDIIRDTFDDFKLLTSSNGIRLEFKKNKGLKTLYRNVLDQSVSFQFLERILFNESLSAFEIADELFVSLSTLYRLIDHINEVTVKYGFQIETNPCRLVGNEKSIRFFYYKFLFEKYTSLDWTDVVDGVEIDLSAVDNFLFFFVDLAKYDIDFAY